MIKKIIGIVVFIFLSIGCTKQGTNEVPSTFGIIIREKPDNGLNIKDSSGLSSGKLLLDCGSEHLKEFDIDQSKSIDIPLLTLKDNHSYGHFSVSPDRSMLAYWTFDNEEITPEYLEYAKWNNEKHAYVIEKPIIKLDMDLKSDIFWSPDNTKVILNTNGGHFPAIYEVVDLNGNRQELEIKNVKGPISYWSPKFDYIFLFVIPENDSNDFSLIKYTFATKEIVEIPNINIPSGPSRLKWSTDGKQFAYIGSDEDEESDFTNKIKVVNIETGESSSISSDGLISQNILAHYSKIIWSPNNDGFAALTSTKDLWIVSIDGKIKKQIIEYSFNFPCDLISWIE